MRPSSVGATEQAFAASPDPGQASWAAKVAMTVQTRVRRWRRQSHERNHAHAAVSAWASVAPDQPESRRCSPHRRILRPFSLDPERRPYSTCMHRHDSADGDVSPSGNHRLGPRGGRFSADAGIVDQARRNDGSTHVKFVPPETIDRNRAFHLRQGFSDISVITLSDP